MVPEVPILNAPVSKAGDVGKTRLIVGGLLFVGGLLSPLLIPVVRQLEISDGWKTLLTTGLVAGLPEIGMLAAVAVLGKPGFALLKQRLFSIFRRRTEPTAVGPVRYRIGLLMLCVPVVIGILDPYVTYFFLDRGKLPIRAVIIIDLVFAASFLVLGAGFWEKIRALFLHRSE